MNNKLLAIFAVGFLVGPMTAKAVPIELVTNGGFETGDFTGWTATTNGSGGCDTDWNVSGVGGVSATGCGGGGSFSMINPGAPVEGSFAAYTSFDGNGPQSFVLSQLFMVPGSIQSATLSWEESGGLNLFAGPTLARTWSIDILDATGTILLGNVFSQSFGPLGPTGGTFLTDIPWTPMAFDVSSILSANAGSQLTLAFSNIIPENFTGPAGWAIDDVSLIASVPEPATLALFGIGLAGLGFARKKKKSA